MTPDTINPQRRAQDADNRRGEFLRALDDSDGVVLSDFEMNFIESFLRDRGEGEFTADYKWFTEGRRRVVDKMIERYGFRSLKSTPRSALPNATPGCCGYRVRREEGHPQVPCGEPAVIKLATGLELCAEHDKFCQDNVAKLRAFKEGHKR